ncbi:MAG TPA: A/G-specific adenine glycosylase [Candidatus Sulfotelmatobacter sp.]
MLAHPRSQEFSQAVIPGFRRRLLAWYDASRRALPWRETRDPYRVWLSEIMLQQTRVAAVIAHYRDFLRRFPTIEKLAGAHEASVLAAWSGLGYYRRARMLHATAKQVVRDGGFPRTSLKLLDLPGIGRYTAAAIASIAFDEPIAVVDGNVERVLERIYGGPLTPKQSWQSAGQLLDARRPGDFNQAMMELGATVCTPRSPACLACPVIEMCATRGELPREDKPAPQKKREINFALHCRKSTVFMVRRSFDASLMAGMWELPEIPVNAQGTFENSSPCFTLRHSITVTDYTVRVWRSPAPSPMNGEWISRSRLERVPLTGLARKILRKAAILASPVRPTRLQPPR